MAGQTSWNRQGPRGVTGPPGPQGPKGPAGTAGDKILIRVLLILLAIAAAILLLHTPAHAQDANFFEGGPFVYIGVAAGIPSTCNTGDLAFATNATAGQQIYEGNNNGGICTFTQQLNSGGGGGSPGGLDTQLQYNNAGSFGGISKWTTNGTTTLTGIATSIFDHSAGAIHKLPAPAGFAPTNANLWGYDSTNNRAVLGNGTDTSFLTWIHGAAPTTNDCVKFSGTLGGLITNGGPCPVTKASVAHQFFTSYTSTTGAFTAAQPDYSDLTGTPTLPQTLTNALHKWFNSYDATTGLFTQTQPAYADISGTPTIFYQTILDASGTPVTQAANLKFTGTAVTSVATAGGTTTVNLTAGTGGSGCATTGLAGEVLYDDGAGGCLSALDILYTAGVSINATGLRIIAAEYDSDVANGATNGTIRFAKADFIGWRNNANGANLQLGINVSDEPVWNSTGYLLTKSLTNASHKWFNSYDQTTGLFTQTQPDYSDLSGVPSTFTPTPHNILSTAHADTTAAAAVRGDGFFAIGATPTWQRLAHPGTSGGYFKWNGTDIVASTGAASGTGTPTACSNQFVTSLTLNADAAPTSSCTTATLASAQFANQGTTVTLLHGNGAGNPAFGAVVSADLNITTTTCTNQFVTAISAAAAGTCTTDTLASAQHANQGTTTTVLHGNGAGNPSFAAVSLANDVTGQLPISGVGSAGLSATSPLAIAATGAMTCTTCTVTVANGTSALGTGAITSATCATVVTTSATGTATTDNIMADFNADPHAVTGYVPSTSGMLTIIKYPTLNNVNFLVCNNTSGSITPGAITLNWRVVR